MKKNPKPRNSRRKFLSLGLLGGAVLIAPDTTAQESDKKDGETIKMLTPDGKLVEVSKTVIAQTKSRQKASNADILKWMKTANKK